MTYGGCNLDRGELDVSSVKNVSFFIRKYLKCLPGAQIMSIE